MTNKNDKGKRIIELDPELVEFLIVNCEANMTLGLAALQKVSRETAEKLVTNIENFKRIKKAAEEAK